ncbi:MAG: riboflavin synthase [Planctomycetaceae bacterium]|jgi:riboflavin synthase|nr:riboflavin synthase [Planctomycetaceae bacterium]MBT6485001.1 riboflavin synthase [Planctomycetaceae bacterium]MBT6497513.1 riboflavin synthase [Planctomycetaceae bacterium]
MFTGLVEGRGTIREIRSDGTAVRLVVEAPAELDGRVEGDLLCQLGDSVAINGCCLTVVEVDGNCWAFEAGAETLSKTNLGKLAEGDPVNLERPLPAGGRLGGHFVQGHVDGVGTVESVQRDGEWVTMWFRVPAELGRQMVTKGSVTIDGVSLTLVDVEPERFSVALIPHTLDVTTLGVRQPGDAVNIETDILGKYVLKFMEAANGQ